MSAAHRRIGSWLPLAAVLGALLRDHFSAVELELIQSHMTQKPVLRGEVGCACVAREVSVERGGMGVPKDER